MAGRAVPYCVTKDMLPFHIVETVGFNSQLTIFTCLNKEVNLGDYKFKHKVTDLASKMCKSNYHLLINIIIVMS